MRESSAAFYSGSRMQHAASRAGRYTRPARIRSPAPGLGGARQVADARAPSSCSFRGDLGARPRGAPRLRTGISIARVRIWILGDAFAAEPPVTCSPSRFAALEPTTTRRGRVQDLQLTHRVAPAEGGSHAG